MRNDVYCSVLLGSLCCTAGISGCRPRVIAWSLHLIWTDKHYYRAQIVKITIRSGVFQSRFERLDCSTNSPLDHVSCAGFLNNFIATTHCHGRTRASVHEPTGERGTWNGERGTENGERRMGMGMGNGNGECEWGMGMGNEVSNGLWISMFIDVHWRCNASLKLHVYNRWG